MVYLILADGFEDIEALAPVDILRRAGVTVQTVGLSGRRIVSARGVPVEADVALDDVSLERAMDDLEMLVLPGGPGVDHLCASRRVGQWVTAVMQADRWLGAICAAPLVPGALGLLTGRRVTCFPGTVEELTPHGAIIEDAPVVTDGKLITARAAGTALSFALKLVEALCGPEAAQTVKGKLYYEG